MLNKNYMQLKTTCTYTDTLELFNAGNGQSIREDLLRQAVKSCDCYATDILILLEGSSIKDLFSGEVSEIDIYFRNMGVNWVCDVEKVSSEVPKQYRYAMKLVKDGHTVYLYGTSGNC